MIANDNPLGGSLHALDEAVHIPNSLFLVLIIQIHEVDLWRGLISGPPGVDFGNTTNPALFRHFLSMALDGLKKLLRIPPCQRYTRDIDQTRVVVFACHFCVFSRCPARGQDIPDDPAHQAYTAALHCIAWSPRSVREGFTHQKAVLFRVRIDDAASCTSQLGSLDFQSTVTLCVIVSHQDDGTSQIDTHFRELLKVFPASSVGVYQRTRDIPVPAVSVPVQRLLFQTALITIDTVLFQQSLPSLLGWVHNGDSSSVRGGVVQVNIVFVP